MKGENKKVEKAEPKLYIPNKWYAITIAPADPHQCWRSKNSRVTDFFKHWCHLLGGINAHLELFIDITNTNGRLHFHGKIKFTNVMLFLLDDIHKLQNASQICIKSLEDEETWLQYCTKDKSLISKHLNINNIPYPYIT